MCNTFLNKLGWFHLYMISVKDTAMKRLFLKIFDFLYLNHELKYLPDENIPLYTSFCVCVLSDHNCVHATDVLQGVYFLTTQPIPGFQQITTSDTFGRQGSSSESGWTLSAINPFMSVTQELSPLKTNLSAYGLFCRVVCRRVHLTF